MNSHSFFSKMRSAFKLDKRDKDGKFLPPSWLVNLVWLVGFYLVWEFAAAMVTEVGKDTTFKFPHLYQIVFYCFSSEQVTHGVNTYTLCGKYIWSYLGDTLGIAVLGGLIGIALGFVFAILMSLFLPVEKVGFPLLLISQMIPMLGLAPIFLSVVSSLPAAKTAMAAYMTFFPVAANMFAGLKSVDNTQKELLKMSAALKWQVYFKLMIPSSLPHFFTGLKLAAPSAVCAVIFTEILKTEGGLGYGIISSQYGGRWDLCWGYIFMSVLVAVLAFYLVSFLEKVVVRYKR